MRDGGYEELDAELYGFDIRIPRGASPMPMRIAAPEGQLVSDETALKDAKRGRLSGLYRHVPNHEDWWYLPSGSRGYLLLTPEGRFVIRGHAPDGSPSVHFFLTLDALYDFVERATDAEGV